MMRSLVDFKVIKKILTRRRMNFVVSDAHDIPADVKEGHFVVLTFDNGQMKRFILKLQYLAHPGLLKLLEKAGEEFGFRQQGAIAVPCGSSELQKIVESMKMKS